MLSVTDFVPKGIISGVRVQAGLHLDMLDADRSPNMQSAFLPKLHRWISKLTARHLHQSVRKLQNKMALLRCEIVVRGWSCSLREESFLVESCSSETFFPPSYEHLGSAMWSAVYLPSIPRPTFLSGVRWFVARMNFFRCRATKSFSVFCCQHQLSWFPGRTYILKSNSLLLHRQR